MRRGARLKQHKFKAWVEAQKHKRGTKTMAQLQAAAKKADEEQKKRSRESDGNVPVGKKSKKARAR